MTPIAASHPIASPLSLNADAYMASLDSAEKLIAGELAMGEITSERAARKRSHSDDTSPVGERAEKRARQEVLLALPSAEARVPQDFEQTLASVVNGSKNGITLSPVGQEMARRQTEAAPVAARLLMENPALNPLEILDQLDPMLAQSVVASIAPRAAPQSDESASKRDNDIAPVEAGTGNAPSTSPSMDRLKALIALLILADLLRDSAKEDQAAQLRLSVASTRISADKLVSAAKANVAGAAAGLTLTAAMAGAGTMKVLSGNKHERLSIDKNLKTSNEHTRLAANAQREASELAAHSEIVASKTVNGGKVDPNAAKTAARLQELREVTEEEKGLASAATARHQWEHTIAQDKTAIGQPLIHGAAAASQLAMQGGMYAGSMHQQASSLAKSDADVTQGTADTERDAAAAHAEVSAKVLQMLQSLARQEADRNSAIVTARAA